MATVQLRHLKLLRRTPNLLVIGIRPLSTQGVVMRVAIGVALIGVGWAWGSSSGILALALVGLGLGIGLPADLGETLVFDRSRDQVRRIRHRYFWPQRILSHPLSAVKDVTLLRQAVDRYAEGITVYRCQVVLHLHSNRDPALTSEPPDSPKPDSPKPDSPRQDNPQELLIGDYTVKTGTSSSAGDPRSVAETMVRWIRAFLPKTEPSGSPFVISNHGDPDTGART